LTCYRVVVDLRWTAHPAKRRPRDVALVAMVVLFSSYAVLLFTHSIFLSALAIVVLLISVSAFLLPTHYTLDDDGVHERRAGLTRSRAWGDLRRLQIGPGAALVSPFAKKHYMDRYRGVLLYFDGADREAVVKALREKIPS